MGESERAVAIMASSLRRVLSSVHWKRQAGTQMKAEASKMFPSLPEGYEFWQKIPSPPPSLLVFRLLQSLDTWSPTKREKRMNKGRSGVGPWATGRERHERGPSYKDCSTPVANCQLVILKHARKKNKRNEIRLIGSVESSGCCVHSVQCLLPKSFGSLLSKWLLCTKELQRDILGNMHKFGLSIGFEQGPWLLGAWHTLTTQMVVWIFWFARLNKKNLKSVICCTIRGGLKTEKGWQLNIGYRLYDHNIQFQDVESNRHCWSFSFDIYFHCIVCLPASAISTVCISPKAIPSIGGNVFYLHESLCYDQ